MAGVVAGCVAAVVAAVVAGVVAGCLSVCGVCVWGVGGGGCKGAAGAAGEVGVLAAQPCSAACTAVVLQVWSTSCRSCCWAQEWPCLSAGSCDADERLQAGAGWGAVEEVLCDGMQECVRPVLLGALSCMMRQLSGLPCSQDPCARHWPMGLPDKLRNRLRLKPVLEGDH